MPSSIPHQKICFYHLPTRGRVGIKIGAAWYVSNVSTIFYCSMLYYLLFWTLLGFIIHFYIIFGTNLLTGGPAQNCCFFAYFRVLQKRNIKRSPNGMKPSGTWFLGRLCSGRLGPYVKKQRRRPRGRGRAYPPPPRRTLHLCGIPVAPPTYLFLLYIPTYPRNHPGSQRKTISTAVTFCIREIPSWSLRRHSAGGGIDHGGLLHQHHSPSDELWVVYHRPSSP